MCRILYLFGLIISVVFSLPVLAADANFTPSETITVGGATTSANATFSLSQANITTQDVLVTNNSTTIKAYVICGKGSSIAATLAGVGMTPVAPGAILVLHKGASDTCAAITASSTASIDFTSGQGN